MNAAHRPVSPAPDPRLCSAPPPTARSRLLAAMTTAPAPRQPPIGPTGIAEGADWRGRRRLPAGRKAGGEELQRWEARGRQSQEGRGALLCGRGSRAPSFSGFHAEACGAGFGRVRCFPGFGTKTPGIALHLAAGPRRQRPDESEMDSLRPIFAHKPVFSLTPRASFMAGILLVFVTSPTRVLQCLCPLWLNCFLHHILSHPSADIALFFTISPHRTDTSTQPSSFLKVGKKAQSYTWLKG